MDGGEGEEQKPIDSDAQINKELAQGIAGILMMSGGVTTSSGSIDTKKLL